MTTLKARLTLLSAAAVLVTSAPASAAVQTSAAYSPWAALSAFASQGSSAALCGTAAAGCALPQANQSAESPDEAAGTVATNTTAVSAGAGIGTLPLLAGLAVLAGLAALALGGSGSGGDEIVLRPVSPP